MKTIRLKAYAKINLGLDVLRKREDGYHDVKMVMQTIELFDTVEIRKIKKPDIFVQANLKYLPTNQNNLAYKAARLFMDRYDIEGGVEINLKKYIPVAAGMAGGSSDAAAVLYGMSKLCDMRLPREELMRLGVKIGADVPFCIMRGTALCEGIGEVITKLPPAPDNCKILVAKPQFSVSTKWVYDNLNVNSIKEHPDIDMLVNAIKAGNLKEMAEHMGNVLETVTETEYPKITEIKNIMNSAGALRSLMSGSGPTVFGLFEDKIKAEEAFKEINEKGLAKQIYITRMINCRGN